jgi:DNA-binding HxlR family transcriptional regulator
LARPSPRASIEEQDLQVLTHLQQRVGVGFNELWRRLKTSGHGMSYTTLAKTLRRLLSQGYVGFAVTESQKKIPRHAYSKTEHGREYELYLNDKLGLSMAKTRRIVKARRGEIRYNQMILGRIPYTCEIELSAPNLTREKEEEIAEFTGTVGDTITSNIAESLNQAYSGFIALLGDGKTKEAFEYLKDALAFKFKLTIAFDGNRVAADDAWQQSLADEGELNTTIQTINTPSYTELFGCWIYSLLNIVLPKQDFSYDLTRVEGWAQMITERSNRIRAERKLPLLDQVQVQAYLSEQIEKGTISIAPVNLITGMLQLHDSLQSFEPDESFSFMLGLASALRGAFENT